MTHYILYTRTSTRKQDYGIEAQRRDAYKFVKDSDTIVCEYTEQESGRKTNRVQLLKALEQCKQTGSTLLISRLDRLSRNAEFTLNLMNSGVEFVCIDLPQANRLTIGILAIVAEAEALRISKNTKAGIAVAMSKGVKWGNPQNLTSYAQSKGANVNKFIAQTNNHQASKIAVRLKAEGKTLQAIANELNEDNYKTSIGGQWSFGGVRNLLKRAYEQTKINEDKVA